MTHHASRDGHDAAGTPTVITIPDPDARAFDEITGWLADVEATAARSLTTEQILTDLRDLRSAIGTTRLLRDLMGSTDAAWFDTRLSAHQRTLTEVTERVSAASVADACRVDAVTEVAVESRMRTEAATVEARDARHEAAMRAYRDARTITGWRIVSVLALTAGVMIGVAL